MERSRDEEMRRLKGKKESRRLNRRKRKRKRSERGDIMKPEMTRGRDKVNGGKMSRC